MHVKAVIQKRYGVLRFIHTYRTGMLFFFPFFIFFVIFTIIPVLLSMFTSLTDYNLLQSPNFIGLTNYKLLFLEDEVFLIALKNTLTFAGIAGPISFIAAFLL